MFSYSRAKYDIPRAGISHSALAYAGYSYGTILGYENCVSNGWLCEPWRRPQLLGSYLLGQLNFWGSENEQE